MFVDTTINGWHAFVLAIPFDGAQDFQDHRHARNFVNYLFSQSKAHGQIAQTETNVFLEQEHGQWISGAFNKNPTALLRDFLARRFPAQDAHQKWHNDGFYPLFAINTPAGTTVSNFMQPDRNTMFLEHPLLEYIGNIPEFSEDKLNQSVVSIWKKTKKFADYETDLMPKQRLDVEKILHRAISQENPSVVLSFSHRDQPTSNSIFHIHRLLEKTEQN